MSEYHLGGLGPSNNGNFSNRELALSSSNGSTRGQGRDLADVSIITVFEALGGRIFPKTLGRPEVYGSCLQAERHKRGDLEPSFHMNERKSVWTCSGPCKEGGGILALVIFAGKASDKKSAAAWLREHGLLATGEHSNGRLAPARPRAEQRPPRPANPRLRPPDVPQHAVLVAEYPYARLEGGEALKVRWEWAAEGQDYPAKTLRWYHLGDDGQHYVGLPDGWKLKLFGEDRVREIAQAGGTVFVVEGEKCAYALNAALVAVEGRDAVATTLGKEKDLLPEHLDAMEGAGRIVVLADSDGGGRTQGQRHAGQLRARYAEVRVLDLYPEATTKEHPEWASDVADFLKDGGTVEQLRALVETAPIVEPSAVIVSEPEEEDEEDDDAPEWPNEKEAPWPTMEPAAFHGLAGEIVRAIEEQTEADPVALLLTLLVAFGSAAGPGSYIIADSSQHAAQLYAGLVGGTGTGRKGSSLKVARRFFKCADADWYNAAHRSGYLSGEALIADLAGDLDEAPSPYPGHLLVIEPELGGLLSVGNRKDCTLSHIYRDLWDSSTVSAIRRAKRQRAEGAYVCLISHITPEELSEKLTHEQIYNGFGNRILFVCVRRSKKLPSGGHIDPALIEHYGGRLRAAMDFARKGREMKRTAEAEELWTRIYLDEPDSDGLLGAFTARGPAQMLRLSVAYALLDRSPVIDVPHLQAAAAVWRYCRASVTRRIDIDLSPDEKKLLDALRAAWPEPMAGRQIHKLFSSRSAKERGQIVGRLVERKLATKTKTPTDGTFSKPASLVRALSLVDLAHTAHTAIGLTTRVSPRPSVALTAPPLAFTSHLPVIEAEPGAPERAPEPEPGDSKCGESASKCEAGVPGNPCGCAMCGKCGKCEAVNTVTEDVPAVSDTKQPGTVPDSLAGVTGTSETEGEI